ncbi:hypothetical protein [Massilia sp. CCM 8734]|uniref:hypothetical protein n=1 Tax=Massilia sp. CCM 8734 TaxID=2609283 RepID=UPI00141F39C7|nr:hypothetical protein [Massilia sp. CCM 8734]NHZ95967.1 hypothetical protein [Massilia sp. CCM 8734]
MDSILFSLPTIANDLPDFDVPSPESLERAPQFHEDEWRQLEFVSRDRLGEVQTMLGELNTFEAANRNGHGWEKIYIRDLPASPIAGLAPDFGNAFDFTPCPAPILTTSAQPLGQVSCGFGMEIGPNAWLYGVEQAGTVTVLGASLQGGDDMLLVNAFSALNQRYGLILVDWFQQCVLVSVDSDGQMEIWRP